MTANYRTIIFAASVLLCCFAACEKPEPEQPAAPEVSLKTSEVTAKAGSVFVHVTAASSWVLGLETPDGPASWATLSLTEGSGDTSGIILKYEANNLEESRSVDVVLTVDGVSGDFRCTLLQQGTAPREEPDEPDEPQQKPDVVPGWLELPAVGDGLDFYRHDFTYNGAQYRNYSFAYDKDNLVALWVAYPLCTFYTAKNTSRSDAWAYDPKVPSSDQPEMYRGVSGYDRGHQIPSADRLVCRDANVQTFYFTNMTPQLGSLNQNIWANFETTVRSWSSNSDTLYVVSGCTLEGSTKTAADNVGKTITVPSGYFKACLRYSKGSTIGFAGYSAVAVFLEHRSYTETVVNSSMSMSIDELEELTGIDFFVNLPDVIGAETAARIEAQDPKTVSWWW